MLDDAEFARWREQAGRTLETAGLVADGQRYEWACFLAEQAAQLAVKGLLHAIGEPAWGHDLVALERQAAAALGTEWAERADEAARPARHYNRHPIPGCAPGGRARGAVPSGRRGRRTGGRRRSRDNRRSRLVETHGG